jgi:hypothetical protein
MYADGSVMDAQIWPVGPEMYIVLLARHVMRHTFLPDWGFYFHPQLLMVTAACKQYPIYHWRKQESDASQYISCGLA